MIIVSILFVILDLWCRNIWVNYISSNCNYSTFAKRRVFAHSVCHTMLTVHVYFPALCWQNIFKFSD